MPLETTNQTSAVGEELTFKEIVTRHSIEIPKIQRDYVQGRNTDHVEAVRKCLFADIKSTLSLDVKPLNLGFIYGKTVDDVNGMKKLLPLDGQQRLTLLFLFHVFAFAKDTDAKGWLTRFSYETRRSSKRFIEGLIENREEVFASTASPSEIIRDSAWFQDEWVFDPTVQSILVVVDEIRKEFCGVPDMTTQLTTNRKVVVTFLAMDDIGLADSLYIKLNARGRPLTDWENFKSCLVGQVEKAWPNIDKTTPKSEAAEAFERKLDGTWTDLFWSFSKEKFDETFRRFFSVQMENYGKLGIDDLGADELTAFGHCLDYLCGEKQGLDTERTQKILESCCVNPSPTYRDKVLLHAITVYMSASGGKDRNGSFAQWMRVFRNLTLNSEIDAGSHKTACAGINAQKTNYTMLMKSLADGAKLSGFRHEQINEEVLKAKLIQYGVTGLADAIYEAEQYPYFDGNIAGILFFSNYSPENAIADANDANKLNSFTQYSGKMKRLFSDSGLNCNGDLFRRALLSFGNYLIEHDSNWSFCIDAKESRIGWKAFLRRADWGGETDRRIMFKNLINQINFSKDIDTQLGEISAAADIRSDDWRFHFVKTECVKVENRDRRFIGKVGTSNWEIRWDVDWRKIALLTKKRLSGYWHCAGILALWFSLDAKGVISQYQAGTGYLWRDHNWYLSGFPPEVDAQEIALIHDNGNFEIVRRDGKKEIAQTIKDVLDKIQIRSEDTAVDVQIHADGPAIKEATEMPEGKRD